ncbi:protein of unknown function [Formivibrio citricus]|uniref:DUF1857 domain-containing protein n=1 Tax=Formivibrio citricus TaxID=83765 RepID=A0A1I4WEI3_9NEIS|nr:AtaL-like protein [Formivibrio citricus]SFN11626.1 protein of unknown function [Formivibrio citricus]
MRYEHLVAVNDLSNPAYFSVSRAQLWRGLLLRVEQPQLFIPNVESVVFLDKTDEYLLREMRLGVLLVKDAIRLQPASTIHFVTEPGEQHRGGQLLLAIEEPEPESLFVRFSYEIPSGDDPEDSQYEDYLKEMWRQVDAECICLIRELAESGRLDGGVH